MPEGAAFTQGRNEFGQAKNRLEEAERNLVQGLRQATLDPCYGLVEERVSMRFDEAIRGLEAQVAWQETVAERVTTLSGKLGEERGELTTAAYEATNNNLSRAPGLYWYLDFRTAAEFELQNLAKFLASTAAELRKAVESLNQKRKDIGDNMSDYASSTDGGCEHG